MTQKERLAGLSVADKFRLMEAIWEDVCGSGEPMPIPEWHGRVLKDRAKRIERGESRFLDWETVKKRLREATQ